MAPRVAMAKATAADEHKVRAKSIAREAQMRLLGKQQQAAMLGNSERDEANLEDLEQEESDEDVTVIVDIISMETHGY